MIVKNDPNRAGCRIVSIEILEQRDELATPVTPLDPSDDVAIVEVQCGQNRACPQALVFMVACRGGMLAGYRRQVWRGIGDGLQSRFLIHRDGHDYRRKPATALILQGYLPVHYQDLAHFSLKTRIATL